MEVTKRLKDPLSRLANDGVRLNSSKHEFHQPAVVMKKDMEGLKLSLNIKTKKIEQIHKFTIWYRRLTYTKAGLVDQN